MALDLAMVSWIQYKKHRQKAQEEKIGKLNFIKIKNFGVSKK